MQIKKTFIAVAAALIVTGSSLGGMALASGGGAAKTGPSLSQSVEGSAPGTETESGSETEGAEADGPGGHEDPPGNVDHQFEGEE